MRNDPGSEADIPWLRFAEHLLASAVGAASSRLVLSLLLRRGNVSGQSALRLLDDASEALQYNRDLLQSAIDQVRHGLSVFDKDLNLICWNRQFRELLDLPADLGRVGVPLEQILRTLAERGDLGNGPIDEVVASRMIKLSVTKETFQEKFAVGNRIVEVRTAAMPQGGIVTTYSDITDRVAAAEALASANETLERRVRERTQELQNVNDALAIAKAEADAANLDKTRFLAAASHDVLQPLNAARLYASSLVERPLGVDDQQIAQNVDASLSAVEDILGALIDIARLDTGRMEPEISSFPLSDVMGSIAIEFGPMAAERELDLRIVPSSLWIKSDRRMLRRVLHNLVSNAIKYTKQGRVVVGVRRRAGVAVLQVCDSGPGIPVSKQALIFREFERLEETAASVRGLGLGLSIVERISKVLGHKIDVRSTPGRGSRFSVAVARVPAQSRVVETVAPVAAGRIGGLRVLCIDNEPAVLEGMRTLLSGWGCTVITGANGSSAIAALRASNVVPDIILADYHLDGSTGLDAIAAIMDVLDMKCPAIVITADHSQEMQRNVRAHGFGLLRKPLKAAALRSLMTQMTLTSAAAE
jgi:signal transduction histidine kinase